MKIELANPRGFCAGVDRAIEIVEKALNMFDNATVIFSAHGVSQAVQHEAKRRQLNVFDATCPLVTKVHMEVARYAKNNINVILIGHAGHPEVDGTMGQFSNQQANIYLVEDTHDVRVLNVDTTHPLAYVTQTTLSVDDTKNIIAELKRKYPDIQGPRKDDICYATQNRQDAIKSLSKTCDMILIVGSTNSSNSNRLKELALKNNIPSHLIDNASELNKAWFENVQHIGLSAGASAPELLVEEVVKKIQSWFDARLLNVGESTENIVFHLPKELRL